MVLGGLYDSAPTTSALILTNFKYCSLMHNDEVTTDESAFKDLQRFDKFRKCMAGRIYVSELSISKLAAGGDFSGFVFDDTQIVVELV